MRIPVWLAPLVLLLISSCSSKPAAPALPPFDTTNSVKDLMANVVDPTADGVWESVGTIYTREGVFEKAPASDEEWNDVKANAMTLVEVGNLLMLPSRSGGNDEWIKHAQELIAQSKRAITAAAAHDRDGVFNTGADIYEACVNCHKQFDPAITSVK
jgi:hypothetical protein